MTKEKKDLIVDSYIKWRISDFSRYYLATGGGDVSQAEVLLKRKFSDRLRSEMGRLDVKDIVTDSRGRLTTDVRDALNTGSAGRDDEVQTPAADDAIAHAAARVARETKTDEPSINPNSMAALGIEVVDVRIKQINLPTEVSDAIYNRMRAEREAVARSQRSQGQEEAEKLRAQADYQVTRTLAEAQRQGLITRGEGDAEAAKLFADAFSGIRASTPLSAACAPMRKASAITGRDGAEPGQRFLPLHEIAFRLPGTLILLKSRPCVGFLSCCHVVTERPLCLSTICPYAVKSFSIVSLHRGWYANQQSSFRHYGLA